MAEQTEEGLGSEEDFQAQFEEMQAQLDAKEAAGEEVESIEDAKTPDQLPNDGSEAEELPQRLEDEPDEQPEEETAEDEPETEEEAEEEEKPPAKHNDLPEELAAQLKELGIEYDAGTRKVATQERNHFWAQKRKAKQELDQAKAQAEADLVQQTNMLAEKYEPMAKLQEALDRQDFNAAAEAMGHKDWKALNEFHLNQINNPGYKESKRMQAELAKRDEQLRAQEQERQKQAQAQARQKQQQEYNQYLTDCVTGSENAEIAKFAGNENFIRTILHVQEQHYDPQTGTTVEFEDAARLADEQTFAIFQELQAIYGDRASTSSETPTSGATTEKPAGRATAGKNGKRKPPKTIPQKKTAEASPKEEAMSDEEWMEMATREMAEANRG